MARVSEDTQNALRAMVGETITSASIDEVGDLVIATASGKLFNIGLNIHGEFLVDFD